MCLTSDSVAKRKNGQIPFASPFQDRIFLDLGNTWNLWAALTRVIHISLAQNMREISTGYGRVLRHLTRLCTGPPTSLHVPFAQSLRCFWIGLEAAAQKVMILKHWELVCLIKNQWTKSGGFLFSKDLVPFHEFPGFSKRKNRMKISKKHGHFHLPLRFENLGSKIIPELQEVNPGSTCQ